MKLTPISKTCGTQILAECLVEEIGKGFAVMKHDQVVRSQINCNFGAIIDNLLKFDSIIIDATSTGELSLHQFLNSVTATVQGKFGVIIAEQIEAKIKKLQCLSETSQSLALSMLYKVYQVEYQRLMHPVDQKEFATRLGWGMGDFVQFRERNCLPTPVYNTAATPLWTTGQVENYRRVISHRKPTSKGNKGDWRTTFP